MSEMQVLIARFQEVEDQTNLPKDGDDLYDLEQLHGCHYVKVDGVMYKVTSILNPDPYGFSEVIPQQDSPIVICYWYNGGGGVHEVVEAAILSYRKKTEK